MKSLCLGLLLIAAAVAAILPAGLGWGGEVVSFLKGAVPVLAVFIGLIALFVGAADIKDRRDARKEALEKKPEA